MNPAGVYKREVTDRTAGGKLVTLRITSAKFVPTRLSRPRHILPETIEFTTDDKSNVDLIVATGPGVLKGGGERRWGVVREVRWQGPHELAYAPTWIRELISADPDAGTLPTAKQWPTDVTS